MTNIELKKLTPQVIDVAKKAGALIKKEAAHFSYNKVEIKGLNDLVSYVDKAAEEIIVNKLTPIFPDAGFIAEENTRSEKREYNWIVDPLDGTTNFVHGIPCYSVSIALEHLGEIILGVVYEVSKDECFSASISNGAYLNDFPINVSQRKNLSESLIATGFPINNFEKMDAYLNALRHFIKNTHGIRRIGSAATDLCYLACGRVDAFFEYNLKPWDVAAGALIVKEAGGTVNDFSGENDWLFGKEISCTNGLLKDEFGKLIRDYFKV